jgi:beta-lactamase regulating signal transducer with metallopeptidase domain
METKDTTKRVVFIAIGVLFVIGLFSLINFGTSSFERSYGNSLNEQIKVLNTRVNELEKEVSDLKSKVNALYILVFISLFLIIGGGIATALKVIKNRKKVFYKEESK